MNSESPPVSEEANHKANEWLKPFREELNLSKVPKVEKPDMSIFDEQINVIIEEKVPGLTEEVTGSQKKVSDKSFEVTE